METYLQGFADPTETARVLMLLQKTDAKIFDRINVQLVQIFSSNTPCW